MVYFPKQIRTRTPKTIKPRGERQKEFRAFFEYSTKESIKDLWYPFAGKNPSGKTKDDTINYIAETLAFPSVQQFEKWFYTLPPVSQKILWRVVFEEHLLSVLIEKELKQSIVVKNESFYYWEACWKLDPVLKLDFLKVREVCGYCSISIPQIFRMAILPWLEPPPEGNLADCHAVEPSPALQPWNNSVEIAESFPLLCDALKTVCTELDQDERNRAIRLGFKKKILNNLYKSSGFLSFAQGIDAPDSVDLVARFVLCMEDFKPTRPKDGQKAIRDLVTHFFNKKSWYPNQWDAPDRNFLEYNLFLEHLSKAGAHNLTDDKNLPCSRSIFYDILLEIAGDGGCFDVDKLADYIRFTGRDFSFCEKEMEKSFKMKADFFEGDGVVYTRPYDNEYRPTDCLRHELLVKPVFKAYGYLFAALGILEMTQESPPLKRKYHDKKLPVSAYDGLKIIRITGFGRWCLGLTDKKPPKPAQEYQAIADRELYLVTVKGNSLERTVYLDKIGQKLGEDRWRISPASFIAGCTNKKQIEERVERFKALIDKNPAPHWERLFNQTLSRAGIFDTRRLDATVYTLPEDRELAGELLHDPALRAIALRAEGRSLVIPAENQRKFFALLEDHGIAHF
ncbi:MAG: hypothetical protein LBT14_05480 [Treponema sp.]|jgi:hypothetical protein|nr:hypothetical protein [Treponema sp.]